MKTTISKLALGVLAAVSFNSAMALTPPPPAGGPGAVPGPQVEREDRVARKPLTRADALANAAKRFDQADTNKDGVLTRDEMNARRDQRHKGPRPHGDHKGPPPPHEHGLARDAGPGPAPAPAPVK